MKRGYVQIISKIAFVALLTFASFSSQTAVAQENNGKLAIELNSVKSIGADCRMTLVIRNGLEAKVDTLTLNLVLFDTAGTVAQSLALSAGRLRENKTRVHQFDLKAVSCDNISRVLINDISECKGKGLDIDFCLDHLDTTSAIKIALIQ